MIDRQTDLLEILKAQKGGFSTMGLSCLGFWVWFGTRGLLVFLVELETWQCLVNVYHKSWTGKVSSRRAGARGLVNFTGMPSSLSEREQRLTMFRQDLLNVSMIKAC